MLYKLFKRALLALCPLVFLVSCGGIDHSSPEALFKSALEAKKSQDIDTYLEAFDTRGFSPEELETIKANLLKSWEKYGDHTAVSYSNFEVEIKDSKYYRGSEWYPAAEFKYEYISKNGGHGYGMDIVFFIDGKWYYPERNLRNRLN